MSLHFATFGLIVGMPDAAIIDAAPIAGWTIGRPARWCWNYYADRGATVQWLA